MKKLKIKKHDFEFAFDLGNNEEAEAYLNTRNGIVVIIDEETKFELRDYSAVEEVIADDSVPDWQRDLLVHAAEVEYGDNSDDYILIPRQVSSDGYRDMERFIWSLDDDDLQEKLEIAIQGKGAFRRFRNVVDRYPEVLENWYKFKNERTEQRMLDWLKSIDIEPEFV